MDWVFCFGCADERYHPGGYIKIPLPMRRPGWLCCNESDKDHPGCKSGSPRYHPAMYQPSLMSFGAFEWQCCNAKEQGADGCKYGSHPDPFGISTVIDNAAGLGGGTTAFLGSVAANTKPEDLVKTAETLHTVAEYAKPFQHA